MQVQVDQPQSADDVRYWLRHYLDWQGELEAEGYYAVPPELGTRIQSTRQGRPTEQTAIKQTALAARVQQVERWIGGLDPVTERLVDAYVRDTPIASIAREVGLNRVVAWGVVKALPLMIWRQWYAVDKR